MAAADQPATPVVNNRTAFAASFRADEPSLTEGGGSHGPAPAINILELPDVPGSRTCPSASPAAPVDGANHGYDACGPPALI
jgi:hypothetical protein